MHLMSLRLYLCLVFGWLSKIAVSQSNTLPDIWTNSSPVAPPIKIPKELLIRMNDFEDSASFLQRFVQTSWIEHLMRPGGVTNFGSSSSGRPLSAVAATIAQFAVCKPELHTIALSNPDYGPTMKWPPCVRLPRCGGCCTSALLSCEPVAISKINVTVMQLRFDPQTPNGLKDEGLQTLTLERHDRCACRCKQQPEDCRPNVQRYERRECRCVCINPQEADLCRGRKKIWDTTDCVCKCRRVLQCSTGFFFSIRTCKCETERGSLVGVPDVV